MILGKIIKKDIKQVPRKILDISLVEDNKSDLTFFNIDEEETNETLKALKQSYVTNNYKEETILNLQNTLKSNSEDTSKELKLESYKRYNNALDLSLKGYLTSAYELIEKAIEINPKDVDILNLKGLLTLLKCDFAKAFESFYTAMCYGNNELSRKYVDMLSSDEFKVFLGRYNHSIRFINEEMNQESIHILENMIDDDPDLIEPYIILSLIYDKIGNVKKREHYLSRLREVDKDNPLFENKKEDKEEKKEDIKPKKKSKNSKPFLIFGVCLLLALGAYHMYSKNKIDKLNEKLSNHEQELDKADKKLNEKEQEIKEKEKELDNAKSENKKEDTQVIVSDEETLYNKAVDESKDKNYKEAIKNFEYIVSQGKSKKYISEAVYQLALLNEKIGNDDEAVKYYKKYINTYTKNDQYYDDAFYQLGMLYYKMGDLKDAKNTFYGLKNEVPDSMYNNSKVNDILKEK
ncbi:tetratricopeptide repeat protein [Romboutsia sp. 1001216sp1]|uniref:tetratricopeptide repeat protein n=1 Tax=unclassified Romboutsia TaxID=2626894 RepID=UPI00189E9482|nr:MULTISPECIES: tetratricopeptide repeat protein [unclassified Romboutsia]MDB8790940.1 tetratricopeptide repeat protein [Romboutsia sp. 1001216sp1]MDB8801656.1 tetratricopeptide repeat protein [Romboutsia sp. 1001216sp1]MDB8813053.1 tetratricopeptide repeat protein [Romboutsia sp. 1001216sp1]